MKTKGFFNFKGRSINLGFFKVGKWRRKGLPLRYYRKPREDSRSALGKKTDYLISLLLIWAAGFFLLASLTGRPATALALSLPLLAVQALLLKIIRSRKERQRRLQQRLYLSGQQFAENISTMDPVKDFQPYVRDILAGLPGFEKLRSGGGKEHIAGIDLEGLYKGLPVTVRCLVPEGDKKTGPAEVRAFAGALRQEGYSRGLLVTSGEFGEGVLRAVREADRRGIKIKLIGRYSLLELARQAGSGVLPGEEASPGAPARAAGGRWPSPAALRDAAFGSRKKARSYFLYGSLLLAGYFILKGSTLLSLIYLFFASLNFLMGTAAYFFGKTLEEMDPLEGLESEK